MWDLLRVEPIVDEHRLHRRKVVGVIRDAFGLDISFSALSESEALVSAVDPAVEEARVQALTERVKHVDATT